MKPAFPLLVSALLVACSGETTADAVPSANAGKTVANAAPASDRKAVTTAGKSIAPWDASGCGDDDYKNTKMERHPALMGISIERLSAAYGKPSSREKFIVGNPVGIFYGEYGRMSASRPHPLKGKQAQILTWTKNGCNFSIFFVEKAGTPSAVHAFEWTVGSDF
jgi:hypothetical protein